MITTSPSSLLHLFLVLLLLLLRNLQKQRVKNLSILELSPMETLAVLIQTNHVVLAVVWHSCNYFFKIKLSFLSF